MPESIGKQIDALWDKLDDMLLAGDFEGVDHHLSGCDISKEPLEILLAIATITIPAHGLLRERARFMRRVKERMIADGRTEEEIVQDLSGLEHA